MTDTPSETAPTFWSTANQGIIGLAPGPWTDPDESFSWPTEGYDGALFGHDWATRDERPRDPCAASGQTREEWLALADEMIARWTAWRAHVALFPAE